MRLLRLSQILQLDDSPKTLSTLKNRGFINRANFEKIGDTQKLIIALTPNEESGLLSYGISHWMYLKKSLTLNLGLT